MQDVFTCPGGGLPIYKNLHTYYNKTAQIRPAGLKYGQPEEADQYNDAPYWELEEESGEDSGEDVNADGGESIGVGYTYGKGSSMQMRNITGIAV